MADFQKIFQQQAEAKELIKKLKNEFFQLQTSEDFDAKYFSKLNIDKITRQQHSKNAQKQIMKFVQRMHASAELHRDLIRFERIGQ